MTVSEMLSGPFTQRLSALRGKRSKAEFAQFLGLKPPTYFRYEAGRLPGPETLRSIAALCGVTMDWLLGRDPPEKTLNIQNGRSATATSADSGQAGKGEATCRYPSDCDLPGRMEKLETAVSAVGSELSLMQAKLDTLCALLGARLQAGLEPKEKAG